MKNYMEFICGITLILIGTICGYMSSEIWQYIGAILITLIGFIIVFMECTNNKNINVILKHIPGYRSGVKFNEVMATTYYLFSMVVLISIMFLKFVHAAFSFAIILAIPFAIFSTIESTKRKTI